VDLLLCEADVYGDANMVNVADWDSNLSLSQ
jgi:hypothetical protein